MHGRVAPGARVLSKPFRKIDLANRVREVLDGAWRKQGSRVS
jgi:hypothetical protein